MRKKTVKKLENKFKMIFLPILSHFWNFCVKYQLNNRAITITWLLTTFFFANFFTSFLAFEVDVKNGDFCLFSLYENFFCTPWVATPLPLYPKPPPKIKNILQYLSFATLGNVLRWKMTKLFTFKVSIRKVVIVVSIVTEEQKQNASNHIVT